MEGILCLTVAIGVAIVSVLLFVVYNPLVLWFWAIIAPKSAARHLDYGPYYGGVMYPTFRMYWLLFENFFGLLPWRSKKEFFKRHRHMTVEQEIRLFKEDGGSLKHVSPVAIDGLWPSLTKDQRFDVIQTQECSAEHFKDLLKRRETEAILYLLMGPTPSQGRLKNLVNEINVVNRCYKDNATPLRQVFQTYVEGRGLPPVLVDYVYQTKDQELIQTMTNALAAYADKEMVSAGKKNSEVWTRYIGTRDRLHDEAQKQMNLAEYEVFHQAGLLLAENAVWHFLGQADQDLAMAAKVVEYDVVPLLATQDRSAKADNLIAANKKLLAEAIKLGWTVAK
jgi:hypothetical protein